ncbi:hypothetical protein N9399_06545 [Porticoccaceae bacterium]|nr:hypothetical protein [Porticoccaceae bacterium]
MAKHIVVLLAVVITIGCDQRNISVGSKIYATCTWTVHTHNYESFVINLRDKSILWVEEEKHYEIEVLEEGYIMFHAYKSSLQGNGGREIKNVRIQFKINRVSGRFDAISRYFKTDRTGNCEFDDAKF